MTTLRPEKRVYRVQQNPMTEAAIDTGFTRDLYVSLGEPVEGEAWIVRVYFKPFVDWIWGGCLMMALGGLLAASDRRYRATRPRPRPPTRRAGEPTDMKSLRFIVPLAIFVVLVGFLAVGLKLDPHKVPSPLIGKPAPTFKLPRLDDPAQDHPPR